MHREFSASNGPSHDLLSTLDALMQRRSVLTSVVIVHTLVVGSLLMFSVAGSVKKAPPTQVWPVASRTLN